MTQFLGTVYMCMHTLYSVQLQLTDPYNKYSLYSRQNQVNTAAYQLWYYLVQCVHSRNLSSCISDDYNVLGVW